MTTFMTTLSLILTLFFTLSLYCFCFCANTFFFVNYDCHISCPPNDGSNNTSLIAMHPNSKETTFVSGILFQTKKHKDELPSDV